MKIFIHEYLAGGGLSGSGFEGAPVGEGIMMLQSALADFGDANAVAEVFSTVDHLLLESFKGYPGVIPIYDNYRQTISHMLDRCDAALIIAPETAGVLADLTRAVVSGGKINLGSHPDAIRDSGDKLIFSAVVSEAGLPVPKTYPAACFFDPKIVFSGKWVTKPVDGAGSDNVTLHESGEPETFTHADSRTIAQEYIEGDPMSLCVVSGMRESSILSVNRQILEKGAKLKYTGGEMTADKPGKKLSRMVDLIKEAIPGLRGFWGVDYVHTREGEVVVIEVNPRLTTSYCALSKSLDLNPANTILDAATREPKLGEVERRPVRYDISGASTC